MCSQIPIVVTVVSSVVPSTTVSTADLAFGRGDETAGEEVDLADTSDRGPMKHCMNTERVRLLGDAIDTLPEKERIVVSLYYYEGLTMREMAEAMDGTEVIMVSTTGNGGVNPLDLDALLRGW